MSRMLAMRLNEKLQMLCGRRGWGQSNLLEVVPDVTKSSMSNWWKGKYRPDLESALRIARALDVPLDYLADDALDDPPPSRDLPADEEHVLKVYRNLRSLGAIDEALATHGMAMAAKGLPAGSSRPRNEVRITAETPDDRVPVPEGYDPTYRAPLRPKDPLDGIRSRRPEPGAGEAEGQAPKEARSSPRRRKPG